LARKFDIDKLQDTHVTELFKVRIRGAFDSLLQLNTSIDSLYESFKSTTNTVSKKILSHRKRKQVNGMRKDLHKLCEERRNTRLECIRHPYVPQITTRVSQPK